MSSAGAFELSEGMDLEPTVRSIVESDLKWVFVGGKGGVGKTTTSCSLGVLLSKHRDSVLILSTDPAHNLSDAFSQKFSSTPTAVDGFSNLFCMEIDPEEKKAAMADQIKRAGAEAGSDGTGGIMDMVKDMMGGSGDGSSMMPGMDEMMSFAELMQRVERCVDSL